MSRIHLSIALLAPALLSLPSLLAAGGGGAKAPAPAENRYVGAKACKGCHSAADRGDQFGKWTSSLHSKAWETLGTPEAKKLAAEKGIADPQKDAGCVKCHVTAFGVAEAEIKKGFDLEMGVQCETCHGPGEEHMKTRMKAMMGGGESADYPDIPAGEVHSSPTMELCVGCHNPESPSYKPFCFHEFSAKIRHLNPKKPREALPIGECSCEKCQSAEGCSVEGCPPK